LHGGSIFIHDPMHRRLPAEGFLLLWEEATHTDGDEGKEPWVEEPQKQALLRVHDDPNDSPGLDMAMEASRNGGRDRSGVSLVALLTRRTRTRLATLAPSTATLASRIWYKFMFS
jgi:hypothetical protein